MCHPTRPTAGVITVTLLTIYGSQELAMGILIAVSNGIARGELTSLPLDL